MDPHSPSVIAIILMGSRPEPFLPSVLKSLEHAVDFVVVNDNSGECRSVNRGIVESSALFASGRVGLFGSSFANFSQARNLCLEYLRERKLATANSWLFTVDCDEVHGDSLSFVTRQLLPLVSKDIGVVDGYFVHFMLGYDLYNALDRKHNLFLRYNPNLHWKLEVHEQLHGVQGRRVCLPYTYFHYGYVRPTDAIVEKWKLYLKLGDASYTVRDLEEMRSDDLFLREVDRVMVYTGVHPSALDVLGETLHAIPDPALHRFRRMVETRLRRPIPRCKAFLRTANYRLRVLWRAVQWMHFTPRFSTLLRLVSMSMTLEEQTRLRRLIQRVASV